MILTEATSQTEAASQTEVHKSYDCVVVGGGPAGCTVATLVAQAGYSTLLVEREKMPRFHIGESLMPETYWTFERLGILPQMRDLGFVSKIGVQFVSHTGKESQPFFFSEHDPRDCSRTWHVERARFDKMLFDNAANKGAQCMDETRVVEMRMDGAEPREVVLKHHDGRSQTVSAQVIVDATGQSALIANRLGIRHENRQLRKAAIWTYFRGADRAPEGSNTTAVLHTCDKSAWFWYIPLTGDVVSIGVVSDNDYLLKNRSGIETTFWEEVARCDALQTRIAAAEPIDSYRVAKEFSYTTRQHAGDGWVLVGDAYGFIDPVYSSGVFLALKSGELAADAIIDGFQRNDLSARQLGRWTTAFDQGVHWMRKLVQAFYTNEFSFGMFMKDHPGLKGNLTDLLIGRVFGDAAGDIFSVMDPAIEHAVNGIASAGL